MSREKQIEELTNELVFTNNYGTYNAVATYLVNKGYRKQSEWISVDERLPERNGRYLTHCNIEGQSLVCVLYYCKIGGFNEATVTHWMPLPEAPKMKGGD